MTTAYDIWRTTDPTDDSIREQGLADACDRAFTEFLEDGHLPDGRDAGDVDDVTLEIVQDAMHNIAAADDDEALLAAARTLRDTRNAVARRMIAEAMGADVSEEAA